MAQRRRSSSPSPVMSPDATNRPISAPGSEYVYLPWASPTLAGPSKGIPVSIGGALSSVALSSPVSVAESSGGDESSGTVESSGGDESSPLSLSGVESVPESSTGSAESSVPESSSPPGLESSFGLDPHARR